MPSGRESEEVIISDYDPMWPGCYAEERNCIMGILGNKIAGIEHIGSTAVPGLVAKPILDLMIGLVRLEDGPPCVDPLVALEYESKGEFGIPGRLYFRRWKPRSHQIHMVVKGGVFWVDHLLFRDYLRSHPDRAAAYGEVKRSMAAKFSVNRQDYQEAKGPFIETLMAEARAWWATMA